MRRPIAFVCAGITGVLGCTTIGVTRNATTDGSTMVTHTADCANCDSRFVLIPRRRWPRGAQRPVFRTFLPYPREVSNRSMTYMPTESQQNGVPIGFIEQVPETYAYWEGIYGYMNEHGLALGESTCPGNFVNTVESGALLCIRQLSQLAMERCATSRCAVTTIGALAERYGFYGEDPGKSGAGEALTLGDGEEVWIFHITGDPSGKSAFWAAQRLPDGHISVVANNFVLRNLNCDDTENFLCSTDLLAKAKDAGAWDGNGSFDWSVYMGPDIRFFSYTAGFDPIPFYTSDRIWRVFTRTAPSMNIHLVEDPRAYPVSVPVDRALSHRDVMDLKRDHFEGSEIDLTVGPFAGPFGNPNRIEGGVGLQAQGGYFARGIALQRTVYMTLGQTFKGTGLNKMWMGPDTPPSSVLTPFYANTSIAHAGYSIGHAGEYNRNSAWWIFNFVSNWMNINYRLMNLDVQAKIQELQDFMDAERVPVEQEAAAHMLAGNMDLAHSVLEQFQQSMQQHVLDTWYEFGLFLVMKYNDGLVNHPQVGQTIGYPAWWLQMFGLDNDIHPKWGRPSDIPPPFFTELGPGPGENIPPQMIPVLRAETAENLIQRMHESDGSRWTLMATVSAVSMSLGFLLGQWMPRRAWITQVVASDEPTTNYVHLQ